MGCLALMLPMENPKGEVHAVRASDKAVIRKDGHVARGE
jgi:hypothetical protein